jgi:hypothetical protein
MYMKIRGWVRNQARKLRRLFKFTAMVIYVCVIFNIVNIGIEWLLPLIK